MEELSKDGLALAVEKFTEAVEHQQIGKAIHETETSVVRVIPRAGGGLDRFEFGKDHFARQHIMRTVEDLLAFVVANAVEGAGAVFVSPELVKALPTYQGRGSDHVPLDQIVCPLEHSSVSNCLGHVHRMSQKDLWRVLMSDLADHAPVDLVEKIARLEMTRRQKSALEIGDVGLGKSDRGDEVVIRVGESETSLPNRLLFKDVPVWEDQQVKVDVEVFMEVEPADGTAAPLFTFHVLRGAQLMSEALVTLVEEIRSQVPAHVQVYAGQF